jgi:hypothetical protein
VNRILRAIFNILLASVVFTSVLNASWQYSNLDVERAQKATYTAGTEYQLSVSDGSSRNPQQLMHTIVRAAREHKVSVGRTSLGYAADSERAKILEYVYVGSRDSAMLRDLPLLSGSTPGVNDTSFLLSSKADSKSGAKETGLIRVYGNREGYSELGFGLASHGVSYQ